MRSVEDLRAPELRIVWEKALDLPVFEIPTEARVFARERWQKTPLIAGYRKGAGAVLWVATSPGPATATSASRTCRRRWPIWDSNRRSAPRACGRFSIPPTARASTSIISPRAGAPPASARCTSPPGISGSAIPQGDEYLRRLIDACHRNAILVYAWLELPHVSEKFWDHHPEWREKTALLQDAQLDWRKLMNLTNRDAFAAVSAGVRDLLNALRLGRRESGRAVFRIARRPRESRALHADERRRAPRISAEPRASIRWTCSTAQSPRYWQKNAAGPRPFPGIPRRAGAAPARPNGSRRSKTSAAKNRTWI